MYSSPSPGDIIDNRFRLKRKIGSGGFSKVMLAKDNETGNDVAVKIMSSESHDLDQVKERFSVEIDALSKLSQGIRMSSIVRPISMNSDVGYIATEHIGGPNLYDATTQGHIKVGAKEAMRVGYEIARSLCFLHLNDTVHLDIKPQNILLREGEPVLIDFNTAADSSDGCDTLFYPTPFSAPEQTPSGSENVLSKKYSDVHSYGKLLYFLATGKKVEEDDMPDEGLSLDHSRLSWPREITDIIKKSTKPNPQKRYGSCVKIANKLSECLGKGNKILELTHRSSGVSAIVRPGDTIGRYSKGEESSVYCVDDSNMYLSPVHVRFVLEEGEWLLRDESKNGTYIHKGEASKYILSRDGKSHLKNHGALQKKGVDDPEPYHRISGEIDVSPVDEELGHTVTVRPNAN